ncbi:hypothetical protein FUT69_05255 [Xylella taiwanensis]|uniref:Uncharacterized protein n=1 Tax=Xylella taiwanensis TaxID=1444770 RepID=A0ABS8TSH3_9GAMM|nr:hypothetical protein [Xylella taiwanensis]MCD8473060.1 hypothetical protein [Xylella taiwanensis]NBI36597.1 hypothetical protein [Xylella taiwanensis]UFN15170.1 hypothetical protein LPH50_07100 [Xylella taiwanensis]
MVKGTSSETPLNVSMVPHRHWNTGQEATCRLKPNMRMTLDSPAAGHGTIGLSPTMKGQENEVLRPARARSRGHLHALG